MKTQLIITFSEKCKQIIKPSNFFFTNAKGQPRHPTLEDWKELAMNIIGTKAYITYETA
jgi:hypothetical protein